MIFRIKNQECGLTKSFQILFSFIYRNRTRNEQTQTNNGLNKSPEVVVDAEIDEDSGQELLTSTHTLRNTNNAVQTHVYTNEGTTYNPYLNNNTNSPAPYRGVEHQPPEGLYSKPRKTSSVNESVEYDDVRNFCLRNGDVIDQRRTKRNPHCMIVRSNKPMQKRRRGSRRPSLARTESRVGDSDDSYVSPLDILRHKHLSVSDSELSNHTDTDEKVRKMSLASMSCLSEVTLVPSNTSDDSSILTTNFVVNDTISNEAFDDSFSNDDDDDWDTRSAISI